jgi:hypothetical protein
LHFLWNKKVAADLAHGGENARILDTAVFDLPAHHVGSGLPDVTRLLGRGEPGNRAAQKTGDQNED